MSNFPRKNSDPMNFWRKHSKSKITKPPKSKFTRLPKFIPPPMEPNENRQDYARHVIDGPYFGIQSFMIFMSHLKQLLCDDINKIKVRLHLYHYWCCMSITFMNLL